METSLTLLKGQMAKDPKGLKGIVHKLELIRYKEKRDKNNQKEDKKK